MKSVSSGSPPKKKLPSGEEYKYLAPDIGLLSRLAVVSSLPNVTAAAPPLTEYFTPEKAACVIAVAFNPRAPVRTEVATVLLAPTSPSLHGAKLHFPSPSSSGSVAFRLSCRKNAAVFGALID
jgi:hypothetical protein